MTFFSNNFIPHACVITNISNTNPAVVTTYTPHELSDGYIVRLVVPKNCGMYQINGQLGKIKSLGTNSFSISIDASNFDSFAYTSIVQIAQVIPVGCDTTELLQPEENANNITPET